MELYLANENFERIAVIDDYEALIWTERYSSAGDFVLTLKSTAMLEGNLKQYKFLMFSESSKVMQIETLERKPQKGRKTFVRLTGASLEAFFRYRTNTTNDTDTYPVGGTYADMAAFFVNRLAINPVNPDEKIPYLRIGAKADGDSTWMWAKRDLLYNIVKSLCDTDNLGWNINLDSDNMLSFNTYRGSDLTTLGHMNYRQFSEDHENLTNIGYLESIANFKNHARVEGKRVVQDVYDHYGDPTRITGIHRRTIVVKAADIGTDEAISVSEDIPLLIERGKAALADANNRYAAAVDGDVSYLNWSKHSYGLGDIVHVKDHYGVLKRMRIVETIYSVSAKGAKKVPIFLAID